MVIKSFAAVGLVAATLFFPAQASAMIVGQPALAGLVAPVTHGASGRDDRPAQDGVRHFRPCPPGFQLSPVGICVPLIARSL